ncbi:MAG: hypothetical protein AMXMBFR34_18820 [Myxococcaceae bacterium]
MARHAQRRGGGGEGDGPETAEGSFTFTPLGDGKVRVEHQVHTEPGGVIAPLVVEPTRRDAAVMWVKRFSREK